MCILYGLREKSLDEKYERKKTKQLSQEYRDLEYLEYEVQITVKIPTIWSSHKTSSNICFYGTWRENIPIAYGIVIKVYLC